MYIGGPPNPCGVIPASTGRITDSIDSTQIWYDSLVLHEFVLFWFGLVLFVVVILKLRSFMTAFRIQRRGDSAFRQRLLTL